MNKLLCFLHPVIVIEPFAPDTNFASSSFLSFPSSEIKSREEKTTATTINYKCCATYTVQYLPSVHELTDRDDDDEEEDGEVGSWAGTQTAYAFRPGFARMK